MPHAIDELSLPSPLTRRDRRRLRELARRPQDATVDDIERLLAAHVVARWESDEALERAHDLQLAAPLLWTWVMAHDGLELARLLRSDRPDDLVVDAIHDGLLRHQTATDGPHRA